MKKLISFAALSLMFCLTGCASMPTQAELASADYGRYMPQDECQSLVVSTMNNYLKDPYSAQYSFGPCTNAGLQSVPIFGLPKQFGYKIVVGINAKNSFGGYVGQKTYVFLFKDGVVIRKTKQDDELNGAQIPF